MIKRNDDGRERILSLSYGKDSLACLGAIEELGWPLDRIVHAEVWATDTIPAEFSNMITFKAKADEIIYLRYGLKVEHYRGNCTFEEGFYYVRGRSGKKTKHDGAIYGWPMRKGQWCLQKLKLPAFKAGRSPGCIEYVGIAADEPNRFGTLSDVKVSPLVEANWDEAYCRKWYEENGLLSPIYKTATRGGCWFCHNQSVGQLRLLRENYPEYWALMLKWDADSPVTFKADGHTVRDYDRRFQLEDEGLISPEDKIFRWSMLEEDLNYRLF